MKKEALISIMCLAVAAVLFVAGCSDEDEDICQVYCDSAGDCAEGSGQMFSYSACHSDCTESMERHESIGCGDEKAMLYDCLVETPCSAWADYGTRCAMEVDYLNNCTDGTY